MDYRKEDIKRYFKDWVTAFGVHHLDIINFLHEKKDLSITKTKDNIWFDTFEIVHQEAFPLNKKIIESSEAAKAFLGGEKDKIKEFVKKFEKERYGNLENNSMWKIKETNIIDDIELVNMYFFIIGEKIVAEWMEDPNNY